MGENDYFLVIAILRNFLLLDVRLCAILSLRFWLQLQCFLTVLPEGGLSHVIYLHFCTSYFELGPLSGYWPVFVYSVLA